MSADLGFLLRPTIYTASAGTGKTYRLTEDFHAALDHYGYENAHRFAAITFTENAAAEMRARIQQKMLEKHGLKALPAAQSLSISTIHSFCRRELKRHALSLGIDPEFGVMEETGSGSISRHALLDVLSARYNSEDKREKGAIPRCVAFTSYFRATSFGASLEGEILADYNRLRAQGLRNFGPVKLALPEPRWDECLLALQRAISAVTLAQPNFIKAEKSRERLAIVQANLRQFGEEIANLKVGEPAARLLDRLCKPVKRNVCNEVKALFDAMLAAVCGCFHEMIRLDTGSVLIEMLHILGELHTRLEAEKRARSVLTFSDLELQMLRLLEDFPDVREEYRGRYHKVFVDEFQDTNPLQVRIIELLAEPKALYYVGDPKQSIFGWRYAEPKTIGVKRVQFADGAQTLSENWRSHPDILSFVNRLFTALEGEPPVLGFEYDAMTAAREFTGAMPADAPKRIAVFSFPPPGEDEKLPPADERRMLQAQAAAAYIKDLVENKRLAHTREDSAKHNEPLTYGDFTILVRKNKTVPLFEQALSAANIPFVSETSVGFLSTPEIGALTAFLQFLLTPESGLLCAQVLRSDLVGVSSDGLAELANARGFGDAKRTLVEVLAKAKLTDANDAAALAEFTRFITALRPRIPQLSASAVLSEAVDKLRLREKLAACGRPFRAALNIGKLIDFADDISGIGYAALEEAASSLREMGYQGANIGEMFVEGGEFVKIMTVHRAKGLGFPAVIIGETDYHLSPTRQLFFDERSSGVEEAESFRFAVKHRYERYAAAKDANYQYKELKDEAEAKVQEEELRLLYVALTRPIEHLAIFGVQEGPGKLWQSILPRALDAEYADIFEKRDIMPREGVETGGIEKCLTPAELVENTSSEPHDASMQDKEQLEFQARARRAFEAEGTQHAQAENLERLLDQEDFKRISKGSKSGHGRWYSVWKGKWDWGQVGVSRYIKIGEDSVSVLVRISDHYASSGGGINKETGVHYPAADIRIDPSTGKTWLDALPEALERIAEKKEVMKKVARLKEKLKNEGYKELAKGDTPFMGRWYRSLDWVPASASCNVEIGEGAAIWLVRISRPDARNSYLNNQEVDESDNDAIGEMPDAEDVDEEWEKEQSEYESGAVVDDEDDLRDAEEYSDIAELNYMVPDDDGELAQEPMPQLTELASKAKPRKADKAAAASMLAEARTPPQFKLQKYLFGMSEFLRWMRGDDIPRPRLSITDNDGELERGLAEWMASHETIDGEEGARELGTAIHALLDFAMQHRFEVEPHRISQLLLDGELLLQNFREHYEILTRAKKRAEKLLEGFAHTRVLDIVCEASTLRTEHAFMLRAAPDAGVFLHGRCDLLLVSGAEISIIDYKTDRISGAAQRDSIVSRYAPQLALYALASQLLYPTFAVKAGLALLDTGEMAWIDALPEHIATVKAKMAEFASLQ